MERKYAPSQYLLTGIRNIFPLEIAPWDEYFMAMAQTDFLSGKADCFASKSYFLRKAPFGGSYAILGGLVAFLRTVSDFRFNDPAVQACLKDQGYQPAFREFLKKKERLFLDVFSVPEGGVFLPHEPAIVVEGDLLSVRIAEGILTRAVNFPTLSMTKWHRCALAARPGLLLEFSRRRAQDADRSTLYGSLGGADFTSNTEIRRAFDITSKGTMGHEWIQSVGDEFKAFDLWLEHNPDKPVLLVDTIDTLKSGIPNAIKAFKKHLNKIQAVNGTMGIRLDSGDLAYLAIEARNTLRYEGLTDVWTFMTNDLDEYSITDIISQIERHGDPTLALDVIEHLVWAAGTKPGTCYDQPSIGGVMKLTSMQVDGEEHSVIKLARDNPIKCSVQGSNRIWWIWKDDEFVCSLLCNKAENLYECKKAIHPDDPSKYIDLDFKKMYVERRQRPLMYGYSQKDSDMLYKPTLQDVRDQVKEDTDRLHWTHKRLRNPHRLKVSLSERVSAQRIRMIEHGLLID